MDSLISWQDWVSMIDPIYYEGKVRQKPYPIELMLRIIILQSFYDLADMAVMYEISSWGKKYYISELKIRRDNNSRFFTIATNVMYLEDE